MYSTEINKTEFELIVPDYLDDDVWDAKGYFEGVVLKFAGQSYPLNFYIPIRLHQEISSEVECNGVFFKENLIVIGKISREAFRYAVAKLIESGQISRLLPRS